MKGSKDVRWEEQTTQIEANAKMALRRRTPARGMVDVGYKYLIILFLPCMKQRTPRANDANVQGADEIFRLDGFPGARRIGTPGRNGIIQRASVLGMNPVFFGVCRGIDS